MNAYLRAMSRYATFSGRSSRSEYWYFVLFAALAGIAGSVVDAIMGTHGVVGGIVQLVHLLPSIAVSVRRFHDIDRAGWWYLAPFASLIVSGLALFLFPYPGGNDGTATGIMVLAGLIIAAVWVATLVFLCTRGTRGGNRFGAEPFETAGRA